MQMISDAREDMLLFTYKPFLKLLNTHPPFYLLPLYYSFYYSPSSPDTDILLLLLLSVTSLYTAKRSRRVASFLQHTVFPRQLLDMARHATFEQYFLVGRAQSERSEPPSS